MSSDRDILGILHSNGFEGRIRTHLINLLKYDTGLSDHIIVLSPEPSFLGLGSGLKL